MTATEAIEALLKIRSEHGYMLDEATKDRAVQVVNELIDLDHWPPYTINGTSAYKMWEGYGVNWNHYAGPLQCKHCEADLCNREAGPPFKREIGVEENDRCVGFKCPECDEWLR